MKIYYIMLIAFMVWGTNVMAQNIPVFCTSEGAIRGYDVVGYFTEGKAIKGDTTFKYTWNGADWMFKSKENMELFKANPEKYAPQYGGYCAYGVSENHKSPTNAEAFTILNNKLYFNYNPKVKELWIQNPTERIAKADSLWKGLNPMPH